MFTKIKDWYNTLKAKQRLEKEVSPKQFRAIAEEVSELATLASQVCAISKAEGARVARLPEEMKQLQDLTTRPEFRAISVGRKLLLKKELSDSRDQLQKAINEAPAGSEQLQ